MKSCSIVKKLGCLISSVSLLSSSISGISQNIVHADEAFLDSEFFHYFVDYVCSYATESAKSASIFYKCISNSRSIADFGQKPLFNIFFDENKENIEKNKIVSMYKDENFINKQFEELNEDKDFFKKRKLEDLLYLYIISDIIATDKGTVQLTKNTEEIKKKAKEIKAKIRNFFVNYDTSLDLKLLNFFKDKTWKDLYLDSCGRCSVGKTAAFKKYVNYISEKVKKGEFPQLSEGYKNNIFMLSDFVDTFCETLYIAGSKVETKDPRFKAEEISDFPDHQKKGLLSNLLLYSALLVERGFLKKEYISKALELTIKILVKKERENFVKTILSNLDAFKIARLTIAHSDGSKSTKFLPIVWYISETLQYLLKGLSEEEQVELLFDSFDNISFSQGKDFLSNSQEDLFVISEEIIKHLNKGQRKELFKKICPFLKTYDFKKFKYMSFVLECLLSDLDDKEKVDLFFSTLLNPKECLPKKGSTKEIINEGSVLDGLVCFFREWSNPNSVHKVKVLENSQKIEPFENIVLSKASNEASIIGKFESLNKGKIFEFLRELILTLSEEERTDLCYNVLKNVQELLKNKKTAEDFYVDLFSFCFKNVEFLKEEGFEEFLLNLRQDIFEISDEVVGYLNKEQSEELFRRICPFFKKYDSAKSKYMSYISESLLSKLKEQERVDLFFNILKNPKEVLNLEKVVIKNSTEKKTEESDVPGALAIFLNIQSNAFRLINVAPFAKEQRIELFKEILSDTEVIKNYESLRKGTIFEFFEELISTLREKEKEDLFFDILKNANKMFRKVQRHYVGSSHILKALFCLVENSGNEKLRCIFQPEFVEFFAENYLIEKIANLQEKSNEGLKEDFFNNQPILAEYGRKRSLSESIPIMLNLLVKKADKFKDWIRTDVQPTGSSGNLVIENGVSEF